MDGGITGAGIVLRRAVLGTTDFKGPNVLTWSTMSETDAMALRLRRYPSPLCRRRPGKRQ